MQNVLPQIFLLSLGSQLTLYFCCYTFPRSVEQIKTNVYF